MDHGLWKFPISLGSIWSSPQKKTKQPGVDFLYTAQTEDDMFFTNHLEDHPVTWIRG